MSELCVIGFQPVPTYEKGVEHTISLANMPSGSKVWLEIDYALIWGVDA